MTDFTLSARDRLALAEALADSWIQFLDHNSSLIAEAAAEAQDSVNATTLLSNHWAHGHSIARAVQTRLDDVERRGASHYMHAIY